MHHLYQVGKYPLLLLHGTKEAFPLLPTNLPYHRSDQVVKGGGEEWMDTYDSLVLELGERIRCFC